MIDQLLRVRVEAEVAAAKANIAALKDAVVGLGVSAKDTSGITMTDVAQELGRVEGATSGARDSSRTLGAEVAQLSASYETLRLAVDQDYAATTRFASAQNLAEKAVASGIVTQQQASATLDLLAQKLGLVDTSANEARQAADALTAELAQLSGNYDGLRMAVDTNYAASTRFAAAQDLSQKAVASGIVTQQQATVTLDLLAQKLGLVEATTQTSRAAMGLHVKSSAAAAAGAQNLAYQFNDVAMMAIAGQSPLMLAIQQGTQISQVFGQGGAADAVGMLKDAFEAFLSPTTLLTVALLYGGTALLQWGVEAFNAGNATKPLAEAVGDLDAAVSKLGTQGSISLADLRKKFAEVTPEVILLNKEMSSLAGAQAIIAATEALRSLKAETEGSWMAAFNDVEFSDLFQAAKKLNVEPIIAADPMSGFASASNPAVLEFQAAIEAASSARGFDNQIAAIGRVREAIVAASGGIENMTLDQLEFLGSVQAAEVAIRQQKKAQDDSANAGKKQADAAIDLLNKLNAEVAMRQAIAKYGQDSVQVSQMRVQAEREVFQETLKTMDVSSVMEKLITEAWEAANKIAPSLSEATGAASGFNAELSRGVGLASSIAAAINGLNFSNLGLAAKIAALRAGQSPAQADGAAAIAQRREEWAPLLNSPTGGSDYAKRALEQYTAETNDRLASEQEVAKLTEAWNKANMAAAGGATGSSAGTSSAMTSVLSDLTAKTEKAMDTLDLSLASINEKVQAGLMTTAEAADAVSSAKESAANNLADLTAQLDRLGPSGKAAADLMRVNMKGLAADLKSVGSDLSKTLSEGFKSPFKDMLLGAATAKEAFGDLGDFIINKFAEMAADRAVSGFFEPLMNMVLSSAAGLFTGGGGGAMTSSPRPAPRPFASGGVPDGAPLSAYRNQVLSNPTTFAMAQGTGLMGEAGAEAIMPVGDGGVLAMMGNQEMRLALTRGAGGRLGVALPEWATKNLERAPFAFAKGGIVSRGQQVGVGAAPGSASRDAAASPIVVNITTPAGHSAQVSERTEGNGKFVDVIVSAVEGRMAANMRAGRGALPAALQETYALPRATR